MEILIDNWDLALILKHMKNILILSILVMSLLSSDEGNDLYVYGLSYHTNRDYPWHEVNPGLGYGRYWSSPYDSYVEKSAQGSIYKNSYGHWTGVATFGPRWIFGDSDSFTSIISINAGFTYSEDYMNLIILPMFGVGYKRVSINYVFMPKIKSGRGEDVSNAIGMFLGWKF